MIVTTFNCILPYRQRDRHSQDGQLELNVQRYEVAPALPFRSAAHRASDDSPVAKKKELEADMPPAVTNDYECLGFDNPTFTSFQSSDDTATTAKLEGSDEKIDLADDSL